MARGPEPDATQRGPYHPTPPEYGPLAVLCGPMGSGKTAVGKALAKRWSIQLRDTDDDVQARTGTTVAEIFQHQGEAEFRQLEHEAVATALSKHRGVLALGGGAPLREDTRAELARYARGGGIVVFLDVSVEFASARVGMDGSRPLLAGDPRQRWIDIMRERREIYESVATMRILTDGATPPEVAREIERRLRIEPGRSTPPHS